MDFLTRHYARRAMAPAAIAAALGIVLFPRLPWLPGHIDGPGRMLPPHVFVPALLACVLGTQLFGDDKLHEEGLFARSLPVSFAQHFRARLVPAAACVLAVYALGLGYALSPLADLWQRVLHPSTVHLAPPLSRVPFDLAWLALLLGACAWLATSSGRPFFSRIAGLVGLPLAIGVGGLSLELPLPAPVALASAAGACLVASARILRRREVGAAGDHTVVLGDARPGDAPWMLAAQGVVIVLPFVLFVDHLVRDWPVLFELPRLACNVLLWLGVGVLHLPWTLRTARASGAGARGVLTTLLLDLTGIGLLWKRPLVRRGPIARCARCGRLRRVALAHCPSCESRTWTRPRVRRPAFEYATSPVVVGSIAVVLYQLTGLSFGVVAIEVLEVRSAMVDVDVRAEGEGESPEGIVRRVRVGRGASLEAGVFQSFSTRFIDFDADAPPTEVGESELGALLHEAWGASDSPAAQQATHLLDGSLRLGLVAPDGPTALARATAQMTLSVSSSALSIELDPTPTSLDAAIERLHTALAREGSPESALAEAFPNGGPDPALSFALVRRLVRRLPKAHTVVIREEVFDELIEGDTALRSRYLAAIDTLVRSGLARFDLERLVAQLERFASRLPELDEEVFSFRIGNTVRALYPELRALSLLGEQGAAWIEDGIVSRNLLAICAAGLSRDTRFVAPLESLLVPPPPPQRQLGPWVYFDARRLAAGHALLCLDRERGVKTLLARLDDAPEPGLVDLLLVSQSSAAAEWLRATQSLDQRALARRFRLRNLEAAGTVRQILARSQAGIGWDLEAQDYWWQHLSLAAF